MSFIKGGLLRPPVRKRALAVGLGLALSACSTFGGSPEKASVAAAEGWLKESAADIDREALRAANDRLRTFADPSVPVLTKVTPQETGVLGSVRFDGRGTWEGSRLDGAAASATPDAEPKPVEIEFSGASLRSIIDLIFTEYLGRPYTVLPDFADKQVNWVVSGSFTEQEILRMFEAFLSLHGVYIEEKGGIYAISSTPLQAGAVEAAIGQKTAIWRLEHLDAKQIVPIIRQFVRNPDKVQVIDPLNTLVVTASGPETDQLQQFLATVDLPVFDGKDVILYAPAHVSPQSLVALLETLPAKLTGAGANGSRTIVDAAVVQNRNFVVIVVDSGRVSEDVMSFVRGVDRPNGEQPRLFYYTLKNQKASEVRQTLAAVVPTLVGGEGVVQITSHDATNSLLVTAQPRHYYEVKKLIDRLDFTVPSVMIDAAIVEVQLSDSMEYGIEWFLDERFGDVLVDAHVDLLTSAVQGIEVGVLSLNDNTFALLKFLETQTSLNVLSRPRVIVKNEHQANIQTVDEVKVISSVEASDLTEGGDTGFVRNFETKEFGIKLQVLPKIAADGSIDIDIELEDSRQGGMQQVGGELQPTFNTRKLKTRVVAESGETVFIGGLIKESRSDEQKRVPLLSDLPLLGKAFRNDTEDTERTELVIFLTPYIMFDQWAARLISDAVVKDTFAETQSE